MGDRESRDSAESGQPHEVEKGLCQPGGFLLFIGIKFSLNTFTVSSYILGIFPVQTLLR